MSQKTGTSGSQTGDAPQPKAAGGRPLAGAVSGAAVLVAYLAIAGLGSLPPFGPSAGPGTRADRFHPTAADAALSALIPAAVKSAGHCVYQTPLPTAIAQIGCARITAGPAASLTYDLFSDSSSLNNAYSDILTRDAGTAEGSGNCGSFHAFSPCETPYGPGSSTAGRVVEYLSRNGPDIVYTVDKYLLLIDARGRHGDSLVAWWARLPPPWLAQRRCPEPARPLPGRRPVTQTPESCRSLHRTGAATSTFANGVPKTSS